MTDDPSIDRNRRFWITATSVTGGIGLAATAVPFVESFAPSERTRALGAPVEAGLKDAPEGVLRTIAWRGKPVFVLERTPSMLEALSGHDPLLADPASHRSEQPEYATNATRSIRPEVLVLVGLCTHLGCIPTFRPTPGSPDLGASWPGGFYCPCHGSKFDLAGRVFKNVPAPTNLVVPPYVPLDGGRVLIGN